VLVTPEQFEKRFLDWQAEEKKWTKPKCCLADIFSD